MMAGARMHLVCREDALAPAAPAVAAEQVVHLPPGLPAPLVTKHHFAAPTRPPPDRRVLHALARPLTRPALLTLEHLRQGLGKRERSGI